MVGAGAYNLLTFSINATIVLTSTRLAFGSRGQLLTHRHTGRISRNRFSSDKLSNTPEDASEAILRTVQEHTVSDVDTSDTIHIIYAACGSNVKHDLLVSLTSLYLFATISLSQKIFSYHVHVLSNDTISEEDLAFLQPSAHFRASIHPPFQQAVSLFKPCATERIYLHEHADFKNLNKVIYVDVDTLWLDFPSTVLSQFEQMRTKAAYFGFAEEAYEGRSWYTYEWKPPKKNLRIPFFGERGLNSGMMIASLEALRSSNFSEKRDEIIAHYNPLGLLYLGDQDILNIYGHDYPHHIHILPCVFNVRNHVRCPPSGLPLVVHGNREIFKDITTSYNHLYTFFAMMRRALGTKSMAVLFRELPTLTQ